MTHISAGDQGDAFAEVGCRFCDDFAEVTRLVRPREFKPSTTIGPRQFASATNQRGTVAPWSSEDPTIDPVLYPATPRYISDLAGEGDVGWHVDASIGKPKASSDPVRHSPVQIPNDSDTRGELGEITISASGCIDTTRPTAVRMAEAGGDVFRTQTTDSRHEDRRMG